MNFNKAKCKVLGCGKPKHGHKLGDGQIESSPAEREFGVLVDEKLTQQCVLAAQKVNQPPGCIKRIVTSRSREENISPYPAFIRVCLEYCIQL